MAALEDVYCTLVMSDSYLPGAAVLSHSLRDAGSTKKLACLITLDSLRVTTLQQLRKLFDHVLPIERIATPNISSLYLMNRPDLLYAFTKIHLWRLTQFRKIVYLDSDVVCLRAPDELFALPDNFAAAPDIGWPDAFNTGVMVISPSMGDYNALRTLAAAGDSFDGADQGLLNQFYEHKGWKRLSFTYNTTPNGSYQYEPAYRYYKSGISVVHFIGEHKPWKIGREVMSTSTSGAYKELIGRWWAVYDRHLMGSVNDYISGAYTPSSTLAQSEVKGESQSADNAYSAAGTSISPHSSLTPEASLNTTEAPLTDLSEPVEQLEQGLIEPTPTVEQRKFSAPQVEWDATRAPPPSASKPEAANFPSQIYGFNADPTPFKPPQNYPEPPNTLHYPIPPPAPKPAAHKLPPIFPWEERTAPKPTRTFAEDEPAQQPSQISQTASYEDELGVSASPVKPGTGTTTPAIQINDSEPWQAYTPTTRNAWDAMPGIEQYVRALRARNSGVPLPSLQQFEKERQSSQTASTNPLAGEKDVISPIGGDPDLEREVGKRRESLILTDFPSAIERPSLPVTPAPVRRGTFWGGEGGSGSVGEGALDLPPAEGVPDQADWDPVQKLEELRRGSLMELRMPEKEKGRGSGGEARVIGDREQVSHREVPGSSVGVVSVEKKAGTSAGEVLPAARERNAVKAAPTFDLPDFSGSWGEGAAKEAEVVSPTTEMSGKK
ncbi:hypothetical protein MBLNU230_g0644t1 [Neophaeotheca triangularis]